LAGKKNAKSVWKIGLEKEHDIIDVSPVLKISDTYGKFIDISKRSRA